MIRPILIVVLGAQMVLAQKYKPDDPVPAGAKGKILDIKGLESGVSGKIQDLNAALKDLGAKVTGTEIRIELSADVLFDFDKADLLPKAIPELEKVATVLKSYPNGQCTIDGYTDGKGLKDYNQKLSERRAASVKTWLVAHNVSTSMSTRGWGMAKPVAPNTLPNGKDNPEGRQKNRRVEIVVKKA